MIKFQRLPSPASLSHERVERFLRDSSEYFARDDADARQSRPPMSRLHLRPDVRERLAEQQHGLCAYCNVRLGLSNGGDVDHYRPRHGAVGADGETSRDHYWWLSAEWNNLLLACTDCNRTKGRKFPIVGRRARVGAPWQEVVQVEKALLLDPYEDDAETHFSYDDEGEMVAHTERARVTIATLNLNREHLRSERSRVWYLTEYALDHVIRAGNEDIAGVEIEHLRLLISIDEPFNAVARYVVRRFAVDLTEPDARRSRVWDILGEPNLTAGLVIDEPRHVDVTTSDEQHLYTGRVARIEVRNFRSLSDVDLDVPTPSGEDEAWLIALGENGVGKSSLLHALALALTDPVHHHAVGVDGRTLISHGADEGSVRIVFDGDRGERVVRFRAGERSLRWSGAAPPTLVAGYGPTRLKPSAGMEPAPDPDPHAHIQNLFSPWAVLRDPVAWLCEVDEDAFNDAARALKRLLPVSEDATFQRDTVARRVWLKDGTHPVELEHLSSGYQSMFTLAVDLMEVLLRRWGDLEAAEGVVMLDELGTHLHPRWQMRVVRALRDTFPRVQFFVTTHDPLCLRGLHEGEIAVFDRAEDGDVVVETMVPSIRGLTVDQILASEHFGLSSTIDPALDDQFRRYYTLLASDARDERQSAELDQLRDELDIGGLLGRTTRERLALRAADEYLARRARTSDADERIDLSAAAQVRIAEIWNSTEA